MKKDTTWVSYLYCDPSPSFVQFYNFHAQFVPVHKEFIISKVYLQ